MREKRPSAAMTVGNSLPFIALTVAFWASVFAGIIWVAHRL
jgi:hypothetical protein